VVWRGILSVIVAWMLVHVPSGDQERPPRRATPVDPVEAILEAFKSHQVVTLPGGHAIELHEGPCSGPRMQLTSSGAT
jgi:hypothetical protein